MTTSKKYGYVRVSSKTQNPERQITTMISKGIDERDILIDKSTGSNFDRPSYKLLKEQLLRKGDLLYVDALDRLGRNYEEVINEWKSITRELGADIIVLEKENIFDSRKFKEMGDIGKLLEDQFLSLLSFVGAQELKKIKERQRQGIENRRKAGKPFGRPKIERPSDWNINIEEWKAGKITAKECMERMEMKRTSFYKLVNEDNIE